MTATTPLLPTARRTRPLRSGAEIAAVVFLGILILVSVVSLFLPLDATTTDLGNRWQLPSAAHWFGTDDVGRDYVARVIEGGQVSLLVGVLAMLASTAIGVIIGLTAGYFRGWVDEALMRFVDFLSSIPWMVLVLVASTLLKPGLWTIVVVIGLFSWMPTARLVRAETLSLRERTFVGYSRFVGERAPVVVFRHILPDAAPTIIVAATTSISQAILTESALSFLGLGIQPPMASWGSLLQAAQGSLARSPLLALIPGLLITLTVLSFNVLGDALRRRVSEVGIS